MAQQTYKFTFPATMKAPFKTVTLRELSVQDELWAIDRAQGNVGKMMIEQILASLVAFDATPVNTGDNSATEHYGQLPPPARQLVQAAFARIHAAQEGDKASFLDTCEISVQ